MPGRRSPPKWWEVTSNESTTDKDVTLQLKRHRVGWFIGESYKHKEKVSKSYQPFPKSAKTRKTLFPAGSSDGQWGEKREDLFWKLYPTGKRESCQTEGQIEGEEALRQLSNKY